MLLKRSVEMKAVVMKANEENGDFLLKVSNFSEYYTKYDEMSIITKIIDC